MRDEEKQIEEMAQYIVNREKNYVCGETTCKICNLKKCDLHCSMYSDITYDCFSLYEAGYRKQSDTAKEILKWLKFLYAERQKEYTNWDGNKIKAVATEWFNADIKELAEKYGVNLQEEKQ